MIIIEPVTFKWQTWRERSQAGGARVVGALAKYGPLDAAVVAAEVQQELDVWLLALSEKHQQDLWDLLGAEIHMLWNCVDPDGAKRYEGDREDFRIRFYEALQLAMALKRVGICDGEPYSDVLRLEEFAKEKASWLP